MPIQFNTGPIDRQYALFAPRQWLHRLSTEPVGQRKLPMVVALHGGGASIRGAVGTQQWHLVPTNQYPGAPSGTVDPDDVFFTVYVQGLEWLNNDLGGWNAGGIALRTRSQDPDDVAVVEACVSQAIDRLRAAYTALTGTVEPVVDEQRLYLAGFSNGGSMVYRTLADSTQYEWRAGASFAGQIGGKVVGLGPAAVFQNPGLKIPMYFCHGNLDIAVVPGPQNVTAVCDLNRSNQNYQNYQAVMDDTQADYVARRDLTLYTAVDAYAQVQGYDPDSPTSVSTPFTDWSRKDWGATPDLRLDFVTGMGHQFPRPNQGVPGRPHGAAVGWEFFKLHT